MHCLEEQLHIRSGRNTLQREWNSPKASPEDFAKGQANTPADPFSPENIKYNTSEALYRTCDAHNVEVFKSSTQHNILRAPPNTWLPRHTHSLSGRDIVLYAYGILGVNNRAALASEENVRIETIVVSSSVDENVLLHTSHTKWVLCPTKVFHACV